MDQGYHGDGAIRSSGLLAWLLACAAVVVVVCWSEAASHRGPRCTIPTARVCPSIHLVPSCFDPLPLIHIIRSPNESHETDWSPHMACPVQAGSAASLEWIGARLTTGRIRGCLKPMLECALHVGCSCLWGLHRKPGGMVWWLSATGLLRWAGVLGGMEVWLRWSPKSSCMDRHMVDGRCSGLGAMRYLVPRWRSGHTTIDSNHVRGA